MFHRKYFPISIMMTICVLNCVSLGLGIADIRSSNRIDDSQKYIHATSGHNGLWLCHNHHKLFDSNLLAFSSEGHCLIKRSMPSEYETFIFDSIIANSLEQNILSDDFRYYLAQRNSSINLSSYMAV